MCWKKWRFSLAALSVFQLMCFGAIAEEVAQGQTVERQGGDFTLDSAAGPLSLSDLNGKVVLMFFGYTGCPDVCPLSLATIGSTFSGMKPEELERVQALFISVDPERDTIEMLEKYAGYFHPNILGVTGQPEVLAGVAEQYGVSYEKTLLADSALGYTIAHTPDILVLDTAGNVQDNFAHNSDPKPLTDRIRSLLSSGP